MAKYSHLKVFKDSYDVTKATLQSVRKFPKVFKYTLGSEIQNNLYEMINLIVTANSTQRKVVPLSEAILKVEMVQIQLRLAKDMQCFTSQGIWFDLTERLCEILRQLEGWKKSSAKKEAS